MAREKRKTLGKKVRFDVFKRDGFQCQYCGQVPPTVVLEVDHITPVVEGGTNDPDNLLTACFDCNRGKGPVELTCAPQTVTEKAEVLAERHEQLKAYERLLRTKKRAENKRIDEVEEAFRMHFDGYSFSPKFRESVRIFVQRIPPDRVVDAMHRACSRIKRREDSIKYFCGICWKIIKEASHGEA